ncbi:MAG TPA: FkbM family methyltransferase [Chthoniobacterales bacterium]|jgi:FkbM family methyltransferase|nr:FkbM family methyltransferase [Chthoniobacterales bacterium]
MARAVHIFDNGVRVYEDHLLDEQRARYEKRNVHEAEEEEIFVDLIRRLPPGGCFVDIGAAIGYYLILARTLAPRLTIHGVEPLERHRRFLRENMTLNGLTNDDLTLHAEGLNSSAGSETLMDRGYSSRLAAVAGERTLSPSARWKRFLEGVGLRRPRNRTVTIATITLDDFVRRIGRPIDLLQMDVQGLEVEVLKGGTEAMKAGAVKTFLIGTHGRARGLTLHDDCRELLRASGYKIEIDLPDTKEQPDGILVAGK